MPSGLSICNGTDSQLGASLRVHCLGCVNADGWIRCQSNAILNAPQWKHEVVGIRECVARGRAEVHSSKPQCVARAFIVVNAPGSAMYSQCGLNSIYTDSINCRSDRRSTVGSCIRLSALPTTRVLIKAGWKHHLRANVARKVVAAQGS